ncbi:guanine nucleotide-binding protein G(i) subunit alpha-1-like [Scomber scombrus]|uniref:Guanine nucleotide-binding protein G(I) subunit alpha-1-like n=1 Tax=Scomber scombrus TaxID=13677 RepID=A0AAV1QIH2_SCOSC
MSRLRENMRMCDITCNNRWFFPKKNIYIRCQFEDIIEQKGTRLMYSHLICAIDTKNVQTVLDEITDVIIRFNLRGVRLC